MPKIRLLLIDSSEIFREGLVNLIQSKSNIEAVSVSNQICEVVKATRSHKPGVVLLDIDFSQGSSTELMLRIKEIVPDARTVAFTYSTTSIDFFSAIGAGVAGYISKHSSIESLLKTIALVAEGKLVVDLPVAQIVLAALQFLDNYKHESKPERVVTLTEQERKVLALMVQDHSNQKIAKALFTSENTVKVHVHNIMRKLSAHTRLEVVACAIEEGLQYRVDGSCGSRE